MLAWVINGAMRASGLGAIPIRRPGGFGAGGRWAPQAASLKGLTLTAVESRTHVAKLNLANADLQMGAAELFQLPRLQPLRPTCPRTVWGQV